MQDGVAWHSSAVWISTRRRIQPAIWRSSVPRSSAAFGSSRIRGGLGGTGDDAGRLSPRGGTKSGFRTTTNGFDLAPFGGHGTARPWHGSRFFYHCRVHFPKPDWTGDFRRGTARCNRITLGHLSVLAAVESKIMGQVTVCH